MVGLDDIVGSFQSLVFLWIVLKSDLREMYSTMICDYQIFSFFHKLCMSEVAESKPEFNHFCISLPCFTSTLPTTPQQKQTKNKQKKFQVYMISQFKKWHQSYADCVALYFLFLLMWHGLWNVFLLWRQKCIQGSSYKTLRKTVRGSWGGVILFLLVWTYLPLCFNLNGWSSAVYFYEPAEL